MVSKNYDFCTVCRDYLFFPKFCGILMKKTASQMHVAPQIVVHGWQYAQDVVPDMHQMMLLSTADIIDFLSMALKLLNTAPYVLIEAQW